MGTALIKIKIMPTSTDTNLEEIKEKAKALVKKSGGKNYKFEEEPIAFGLKAVIVGFEQDEKEGKLEPIEDGLNKLENVNSVQVIDIRRAFG